MAKTRPTAAVLAAKSSSAREIGTPPPAGNRRNAAAADFELFCRDYLPQSYPTPAALALWAVLTKRRSFVVLAADALVEARTQFELVLTELVTNDRLLADWPAVCFPIRHFRPGQQSAGLSTCLSRTANKLVLPGESSVIAASSIGRAYAKTHTQPDGTVIQPDLIVFASSQPTRDPDGAARAADPSTPLDVAGPAVRLVICTPRTKLRYLPR